MLQGTATAAAQLVTQAARTAAVQQEPVTEAARVPAALAATVKQVARKAVAMQEPVTLAAKTVRALRQRLIQVARKAAVLEGPATVAETTAAVPGTQVARKAAALETLVASRLCPDFPPPALSHWVFENSTQVCSPARSAGAARRTLG